MIEVTNPISPGFHPDPFLSPEGGGGLHLATSTFEWFPGVEIPALRDLVQLEIVARPLDRPELLDHSRRLERRRRVGALSELRGRALPPGLHHITRTFDETTQDTENFLVTAPDVSGPWSERIALNAAVRPVAVHDPDGNQVASQHALVFPPGENHFPGILLQQYSPRRTPRRRTPG
jgi:xylan 1,4-beta-xylosidase